VFHDITFNTTYQISGWTHTNGTGVFICGQKGLYWVTLSVAASQTANSFEEFTFRALVNGVTLPGSAFSTTMTVSGVQPYDKQMLMSLNNGDTVEFQAESYSGNGNLFSDSGGPVASVTIVRIQ